MRSQLYYVQDSRRYVGNDVLWWARNDAGYTTNLADAEIYTASEVSPRFTKGARDTDVVWPFDYINSLARRAVDMQKLNKDHVFNK